MRIRTWIVSTACLLAIASTMGAADEPGQYLIRTCPPDFEAALKELARDMHLDVAGVNVKAGTIDLVVNEVELAAIDRLYPCEILRTSFEMLGERLDSNYKTPDEIQSLMTGFASSYPSITQLVDIGPSFEGRSIWAIKISDNPSVDEDEPEVLFNGMHHAREVMTPEICLDIIVYLCSNYPSDPDVAHWVNNREIWVIPMLNVDGNNYVWTNDNWWRKDRHAPPSGSCYGIDPNRNYPQFWGTCNGSSGNPCDDDYRGQTPAQSNCVARMMEFSSQRTFIFDISLHSYSEMVIYPYGCQGDFSPEDDMISAIGQQMASLIQREDGGYGYYAGTSWQLLYATDGGDIDWHYAANGTVPFVIEVNADDFQPAWSLRDITCQRLRPAWQYLLDRIDGSSITGKVLNACTGEPVSAVVELEEVPLTSDESPRTTDEFGRYTRIVLPGDYTVMVSALGFATAQIPVSVGFDRADLDIPLVPVGSYGLYPAGHEVLDMFGDGDGVLDPDETASIRLDLRSVGNTTGVYTRLSAQDMYVNILDDEADFGDISDNSEASSQPPHFTVEIAPNCPEGHVIQFTIQIYADQTLCADSGTLSLTVSSYVYECPVYEHTMDTNPSYVIQNSGSGGWAYGDPSGSPSSPHTGTYCYGTNLSGNYGNNGNFNLTSAAFDCSGIRETRLIFWRWLHNETGYDTAYVQVSNDNSLWTTVWSGYAADNSWTELTYDISEVADGESTVYIRWKLSSDSYLNYEGFYIDDVMICGKTAPDTTPTPAPTWTSQPPTSTPTPSPIPPTGSPTGSPTSTPTGGYPSPTVTSTAGYETPTATPPPDAFTAYLTLNDTVFEAGDPFLLSIHVLNRTQDSLLLDRYLLLEVSGMYFFAPDWTQAVDHESQAFASGFESTESIFSFEWPENTGQADGLRFWLGFLDAASQSLVCDISSVMFGYR